MSAIKDHVIAEMNRRGDWCQTFAGRQFFPLDPKPEDICIEDIGHALSNLCRFGGHCREFYSVAQHCVIVAEMLPEELKLAGLLHDATEAYLVDIPRPLKRALSQYREIEHALEQVVAEKFGVDFGHPLIKQADNIALMTEARDLLGPTPAGWGVDAAPADIEIVPLSPHLAEYEFRAAFSRFAL